MQKKTIKFQAVLFGTFNFPADPDTTVKLMTIFAPLGFMPQVMNVQDPIAGLTSQRLGLTKGSEMQIQFSPDRIDFTAPMPSMDIDIFLNDVVDYVGKLERGSLQFNRAALVIDALFEELSQTESEALRGKLLPQSGINSVEWVARWVTPLSIHNEQYNACFEAVTATGLMMIINGRMHPLSGIKTMHDVSTTPSNTAHRFNVDNLQETLYGISKIILDRDNIF